MLTLMVIFSSSGIAIGFLTPNFSVTFGRTCSM